MRVKYGIGDEKKLDADTIRELLDDRTAQQLLGFDPNSVSVTVNGRTYSQDQWNCPVGGDDLVTLVKNPNTKG